MGVQIIYSIQHNIYACDTKLPGCSVHICIQQYAAAQKDGKPPSLWRI